MSPFTEARMHLAVELSAAGRHPAAARWARLEPAALAGPTHHVALARTAARRGLDLVAIPHTFRPDGGPVLDAVALAARIAPVVPGIGLVPTATVTHTEPFHVSKAIATLDIVSLGRAGWEPRSLAPRPRRTCSAARPGAAGRAVARGRRRDRGRGAAVGLVGGRRGDPRRRHRPLRRPRQAALRRLRGRVLLRPGPVDHPRPPQGHPLVVLRGDEEEALPVAARWADVVRIAAPDLDAAGAARERIRAAVADAGRDPDEVTVLLDVEVHLAADRDRARRDLAELDAIAGELPPSSTRVVGAPTDLADLVGAPSVPAPLTG